MTTTPTEITYRFPVPRATGDNIVTDGNLTVAAYELEVVRYHSKLYARVTGQIVRKSDGLVSSQTRRIVFGNPERAAYLQPIADAPQWVREAYEFVEAQA